MSAEEEGRAAAEAFRLEHHLGDAPLGDLVALIDDVLGIDVSIVDTSQDQHGLTVQEPRNGDILILVARTRNPMRQRSTLAHEVAHAVFKDWRPATQAEDLTSRQHDESRADSFARHLLVPLSGLNAMFEDQDSFGLRELSTAVQRFLASPSIVAIAAHNAGLVSASTKKSMMTETTPKLAARFGWSDHYRVLQQDSNTHRAPQRLLARAVEGYVEGVVSLATLARWRDESEETVLADLEAAGIFPVEGGMDVVTSSAFPDLSGFDFSELDEPATDEPAPKKGQ